MGVRELLLEINLMDNIIENEPDKESTFNAWQRKDQLLDDLQEVLGEHRRDLGVKPVPNQILLLDNTFLAEL